MKTVSVVIPTLRAPHLDRTIESILKHGDEKWLIEILVVGLDDYNLIPIHKKVRFISTSRPVNASTARNIGARAALGEIICFIDSDCYAMAGWPLFLLEHFEQGAVVVGGGVSFEKGDYWAICDNVVALWPFLSCMAAGVRNYLPTLNFAIDRRLFEMVGGFDETIEIGEDVDLSLRLRRMGYHLYFEPRAAVQHAHNRTTAVSVWRHLGRFGEVWMAERIRSEDLMGRPLRFWLVRHAPFLVALGAPIAATLETIQLVLGNTTLRRYWHMMPGLVWAKFAWYVGVARTLKSAVRT